MDKIVFDKIVIEGYRNFQKATTININRPGVTLVKGINEAGKTTIWDALYFCLEGQNFAGLNKDKLGTWEEKRTSEYRGTRVVTDFYKGETKYRVARHINFKGTTKGAAGGDKLMLFKDGELISTGVNNTQALIDEILGMSASVFMNSIIFGQRMTRLIKSKDAEKRKLFDEIFSVMFIPKAREKGKEKITHLSTNISSLKYKIERDEQQLTNTEIDLNRNKKLIADFEADKTRDLNVINGEIQTWETRNNKVEEDLKLLQNVVIAEVDETILQKKYEDLRSGVEESEGKLRRLNIGQDNFHSEMLKSKNKITDLQHQLEHTETKCLSCEQDLPKSKVKITKENIKKQLTTEEGVLEQLGISKAEQGESIPKLKDKIDKEIILKDKAKAEYDSINDTLRANIKRKSDIRILANQLEELERSKRSLDIRIKAINDKKPLNIDLKLLENTLKELGNSLQLDSAKLMAYQVEKDMLDWWVTKAFGNSGLKAHVFNAMLNRLNMYMEKYANVLGSRVRFSVDLTKSSSPFITTVYRKDKVVEYEELSGGAQQRVDICLAFACHDLVSQTNNINLLIMDEIMEGLDAEGIEQVFSLIRMKAKTGDSIYIISHLDNLNSKEAGLMRVTNDGINSYVE